ncbi:MAG TPA: hypothetical protein VM032_09100 [Vicinamibacterales bacterium]|nr:hypothetical protein [Vicinamibacterales bacterium]
MRWTVSSAGRVTRHAARLSLGIALVLGAATASGAQQGAAQGRTVQGVWYVQVTIHDCASGVAVAPPVNSLVTFAAGGTLQENVSGGGFAPGQRSSGHGTWTHREGQSYDQRFVAMINFATAPGPGPGFEAGWMKVQHTVTMIDADHIESAGTNSFYRLNGDVYRTGCSTAAGTRFE